MNENACAFCSSGLTFVVASHHRVPWKTREVAINAEAKAILGPLKRARLVDHSTREHDSITQDGRPVCRFDGKSLLWSRTCRDSNKANVSVIEE